MKLSLSIVIFALATSRVIGSEAVNVYYDDKTYNICQGQQAFLHSTGNNGLCAYSHSEWTSGNYLGTNECEGLAPESISRGNGQDIIYYIQLYEEVPDMSVWNNNMDYFTGIYADEDDNRYFVSHINPTNRFKVICDPDAAPGIVADPNDTPGAAQLSENFLDAMWFYDDTDTFTSSKFKDPHGSVTNTAGEAIMFESDSDNSALGTVALSLHVLPTLDIRDAALRIFGTRNDDSTSEFRVHFFNYDGNEFRCQYYTWADVNNDQGLELCGDGEMRAANGQVLEDRPEYHAITRIKIMWFYATDPAETNPLQGTFTKFQVGDICVSSSGSSGLCGSCEALEQEWLDADCACTDSADCTAKKTAWSDAGCAPQTCG